MWAGAMDLNSLGLFKLLKGKLSYLDQRQEVLAQNIANADTPKFKPRDLADFNFKTVLARRQGVEPERTDPAHLSGTRSRNGDLRAERERRVYETKPDGNAVVIEEQMIKVNRSAIDQSTVAGLYRKQIGLLKSAIGRGST